MLRSSGASRLHKKRKPLGDFIARIKAYLMSNSPSVMSVGARVCVFGFIFVWFPGFSPGLITPNGLVIALNEHNYIPYISARVVLDAMRNPDQASRKVGVEVCHGELRLCDKILVGDLAFVKRDKHEEVAMPATEGASSSSTARWIEEPNEDAPAQAEDKAHPGHPSDGGIGRNHFRFWSRVGNICLANGYSRQREVCVCAVP